MAYNVEKLKVLEQTFEAVASLVGDRQVINGHEVGLDLTLEKDYCLQSAQAIRDGIFKVVVMGAFHTGKSTVINALLGRDVLQRAHPSTSVLTFVQYDDRDSFVEVHYKQEQNPDGSLKDEIIEKMDLDTFKEVHYYTVEDDKEFSITGKVKRFDSMNYAVVKINCPFLKNGVKIVDSPVLKNNVSDNALFKNIMAESNAIICVGSALDAGYDIYTRMYFNEYFKGCPNNVFYIINKFDLCKTRKDKEDVRSKVESDLKPYFTRSDGSVDRELMSKRIFYVSAFYELESKTRIAEEYEGIRQLSEKECRERSEKSGYRDFEPELEYFLTTDEKCKAEYHSNFRHLSNIYKVVGKYMQYLQNEKKRIQVIKTSMEYEIFTYEMEEKRCRYIMDTIYSVVANAYWKIFNHRLSLDDLVNYSSELRN